MGSKIRFFQWSAGFQRVKLTQFFKTTNSVLTVGASLRKHHPTTSGTATQNLGVRRVEQRNAEGEHQGHGPSAEAIQDFWSVPACTSKSTSGSVSWSIILNKEKDKNLKTTWTSNSTEWSKYSQLMEQYVLKAVLQNTHIQPHTPRRYTNRDINRFLSLGSKI